MAAALLVGLTVASCSSKKSDSSESVADELRNTHLLDAIRSSDMARTASIADSMALDVDDLSNHESVAVLMAYLEIHNDASRNEDRQRDLETLRKYVDVYELSLQRDRSGMQEAIDQARSVNPEVDLTALYTQFKGRLAEYDAVNGGELTVETPEDAPADSTATDSVTVSGPVTDDEVPVEFRPAD